MKHSAMAVDYAPRYANSEQSVEEKENSMKDESRVHSVLFAGVGGQGIIRASDIMCMVMMEAGFDVKKSEVHGMAQRGGCVNSDIRYGKKVYSPLAEATCLTREGKSGPQKWIADEGCRSTDPGPKARLARRRPSRRRI